MYLFFSERPLEGIREKGRRCSVEEGTFDEEGFAYSTLLSLSTGYLFKKQGDYYYDKLSLSGSHSGCRSSAVRFRSGW